jgi:hypothetical protein
VRSWRFQPDSGGPPIAICAANQVTCGFRPLTPGRVYVRARFNNSGWQFQSHRAVNVALVKLVLVASRRGVSAGEPVNFTLVASPARPIAASNWGWTPASTRSADFARVALSEAIAPIAQGVALSGCTGGDLSCVWQVNGTMWKRVTALVNGRPKADSVRVVVVPCPTGDPILDDPDIRSALKDLWELSDGDSQDSTIFSNRKEQGGLFYQDTISGRYTFVPATIYSDQCRNISWPPDPPPPGLKLVGRIHTHPVMPGATVACPNTDFAGYEWRNYPSPGEHSRADLLLMLGPMRPHPVTQQMVPNPFYHLTSYVMDGRDIHRVKHSSQILEVIAALASVSSVQDSFSWRPTNGCRWYQ